MIKSIILFFFLIFSGSIFAQNAMKAPIIIKDKSINYWGDENNFYNFYKKYISPIDGDRCMMYPSCSTYSKEAIGRFGFFRGFVMTCDRLTRCGNDLHKYPQFIYNGRVYIVDPVESEKIFEN